MQATVVDLRYKMNDVLSALDRNEDVEILYRGKRKGVLVANARDTGSRVVDHPYFNMRGSRDSVEEIMDRLRGGRFSDL